MENEDGKNEQTSGNRMDDDDEMQKSGKRNPSMLLALDAVHRSLLNNNLKYEGKMRSNSLRLFFSMFFYCFHFRSEHNNLNAI